VVAGIAVVLVVVFAVGSAVSTHPTGVRASRTPNAVVASGIGVAVPGTTLRAVAAAPVLHPIVEPGVPPSDITGAVSVPVGARRISADLNASNTSQYERSVALVAATTQGQLLAFYRQQLPAHGWRLESTTTTSGHGLQLLAQRGGSDGWYWEVAVKLRPTTFSGPAASGSTRFSIDLLQQSDNF
jgi:hypothetical protein